LKTKLPPLIAAFNVEVRKVVVGGR